MRWLVPAILAVSVCAAPMLAVVWGWKPPSGRRSASVSSRSLAQSISATTTPPLTDLRRD